MPENDPALAGILAARPGKAIVQVLRLAGTDARIKKSGNPVSDYKDLVYSRCCHGPEEQDRPDWSGLSL